MPFHIRPGAVLCEVGELSSHWGSGILMADSAGDEIETDVQKVLAAGSETGLKAGDLVITIHHTGTWIKSPGFAGRPDGRPIHVALYGMYWDGMQDQICDFSHQVLAKVEGGRLIPTRQNILIAREAVPEQVGGVFLPDSARYRSRRGVVLEVGPDVKDDEIVPGALIGHYSTRGAFGTIGGDKGFGDYYGCDTRDLMFVTPEHLNVLLMPDEQDETA